MHVQVDSAGIGEVPGRERRWGVRRLGDEIIVRHYIVDLQPEEDVRDYPETHVLTVDEWAQSHSKYGLTIDGKRV